VSGSCIGWRGGEGGEAGGEGEDVVGFGWGRGCEREGGRDGLRGLGSVLSETMGWGGEGSGGRVVVMDLFREISALLRWGCRCRGCT